MADVFDFYVKDNRTIQFNLTEPIMLEDSHVSDWVFHIPRVLNNIDMSGWAWWLVYINARGQKYSELLTLSEDPESPLEKCIATYSVDYGMSIKAGTVRFSLEAINADAGGEIGNEWHTKTYQTKVQDTLQGNQVEYAETESDIISALIIEVQNKVSQLVGGATPEPVSLIADMTDTSKVYLYVGSETGKSTNYWYYYNGSAWVAGGLYASGIQVDAVPTQGSSNAVQSGGVKSALDGLQAEIPTVDSVPTQGSSNAVSSGGVYEALHDTDATLSQSGQAADAKAVGDKITSLKADLTNSGVIEKLTFTPGYYISLSGATADITSPVPSTTGFAYATKSCHEGDTFIINAVGGNAPRAWGFIDAYNSVISVADASTTVSNYKLVAPENAVCLVVNDKSGQESYVCEILNDLSDVNNTTASLLSNSIDNSDEIRGKLLFSEGAVNSSGEETVSTTRVRTDYIDIDQYAYYVNCQPTVFSFWVRVFNSEKSIIGTAVIGDTAITSGTEASTKSFILSAIRDLFSSAKYIRIVAKRISEASVTPSDVDAYLVQNGVLHLEVASVPVEHGTLKTDTGNLGNGWSDIYNRANYIRTEHFIKAIPGSVFRLNTVGSGFRIIEYDKSFGFVKCTQATSMIQLSNTTKYIKLCVYAQNITIKAIEFMFMTVNGVECVKNSRTSINQESFIFEVGNSGNYTTGMLKLPSNYNALGDPVPLIVFVHGSGDYVNMYVETMTNNYTDYYNYLRDNGYALFDCYGWDSSYQANGSNTFGTPDNMQCFNSGIDYVLSRWNLDANNIFVSCKSLGGIVAASLALENKWGIKAVGMLAPALDMLEIYPFGYQRETRCNIAKDVGFIGDWQSVLDVPNEDWSHDAAFEALITQNANVLCGYIPVWKNVTLSVSDKVANSLNHTFNTTAYQFCDTPVKIWCAQDDQAVFYSECSALVQRIKNGGGIAEMRTMPSNTGGHHSVDNDANAPQTTNVTTKLGVTYATIPTAYYELCEWFNKFII